MLSVECNEIASPSAAALRRECFADLRDEGGWSEKEAEIDSHSLHIEISFNRAVIGYCRITKPTLSVFGYFMDDPDFMPTGRDVWSLGRGCVSVTHRRRGLLPFVVLDGIRMARSFGAAAVIGAMPPTENAIQSIKKSSMVPIGEPIQSGHRGRKSLHQCVIHDAAMIDNENFERMYEAAFHLVEERFR
ncbi:hypothetical protein [Hyphococcus sp.]|jgi:hypothetical protein|uniref:hypothetical protein n=1 Tax=Hyphococcus sp. TaxID=2038636 RepID=UPI003D0DDBF3